jgi:hypothetical protein
MGQYKGSCLCSAVEITESGEPDFPAPMGASGATLCE